MNNPVITSVVKNANGSWTFIWSNVGAAYYRVVLWGIQLLQTTDGTTLTYTWNEQEYVSFPPPLEVVSETNKAVSEQFLPYLIMQWYGEPACSYYLVQQNRSGTWTTIRKITESGLWIVTFQTAILADETAYSYRVIAVDDLANQSTPRSYSRNVVCPPAPPDANITITYNKPNVVINSV